MRKTTRAGVAAFPFCAVFSRMQGVAQADRQAPSMAVTTSSEQVETVKRIIATVNAQAQAQAQVPVGVVCFSPSHFA